MAENEDEIQTPATMLIKQGGNLLSRFLGPAADEIGEMLAERIRGTRFRKQVKLLTEAERYIAENGIKTNRIAIKKLVPLLEYASLEEEESLQEKWKAMLINYADVEKSLVTNVFPYILSQISGEEYHVLEDLIDPTKAIAHHFLNRNRTVIFQNLERLGLVERFTQLGSQVETYDVLKMFSYVPIHTLTACYRPGTEDMKLDSFYAMTDLGKLFIEACSLPK